MNMENNYVKLSDTLSAQEGNVYITIAGQNRPLFEVVKISASVEKDVKEKKMLGNRITQHKIIGASISGSVTLALMNGDLLKATVAYLKTGVYPSITIQLKNLDQASTVGTRQAALTGVIFKTELISMLDSDSDDIVTYDTDFTADGIELLNDFVLPANYR